MNAPLRIIVVNHFPLEGSGSGTYVRSIAAELHRRGHAVRVIAPDHDLPRGYPFEVDTIRFRRDGDGPAEGVIPFNFPCFTTHPRSQVKFADLSDSQLTQYREAFRVAITAAVRAHRPDVLHGQHLWIATGAAARTGIPLVATCHGTDLLGLDGDPRGRGDAEEAARGARRVLAVSSWVAERVQERLSVLRERVVIVRNGFDPSVFRVVPVDRADLLQRHGLPREPRRLVLFMGKLARFKGANVLLEAAARYERLLPDTVTLLAGEGEMRDELRSNRDRLGLKNVHLLGHQTIEEVVRMYNAADLVVVPSLDEPFGLVALEALACGTPVVGTRAGGLVDFIDDSVGGLVPPNDPDALAARIVEEIRGECKSRKGPVAARVAHDSYTWSAQVGKIEAVYREVLHEASH
ncbi:MAG: glycosyltransferase [Planctomycetes bacterium]|nr:glycosyltransferase [Planctomycetota bacterium]MBI3845744.1 glycosyltransferase [Planctomycetota bacterium]